MGMSASIDFESVCAYSVLSCQGDVDFLLDLNPLAFQHMSGKLHKLLIEQILVALIVLIITVLILHRMQIIILARKKLITLYGSIYFICCNLIKMLVK